jgi:hypothetical protein
MTGTGGTVDGELQIILDHWPNSYMFISLSKHTLFPSAIHFTQKMQEVLSSKSLVSFHITTCHNSEDNDLNLHHCENLKSCSFIKIHKTSEAER